MVDEAAGVEACAAGAGGAELAAVAGAKAATVGRGGAGGASALSGMWLASIASGVGRAWSGSTIGGRGAARGLAGVAVPPPSIPSILLSRLSRDSELGWEVGVVLILDFRFSGRSIVGELNCERGWRNSAEDADFTPERAFR